MIDLDEIRDEAHFEQILALPTLIRKQPSLTRGIIGDLADTDRVLISLDVKALDST